MQREREFNKKRKKLKRRKDCKNKENKNNHKKYDWRMALIKNRNLCSNKYCINFFISTLNMSSDPQIYVRGFSKNCKESDLKESFNKYGNIKEVRLIRDYAFIVHLI